MKLTAILACGTYYSPWTSYALASFYFCDEIIVVNGGYDIKRPDPDIYNVPLKKVTDDIKKIDVCNKIIEITNFTVDDLERKAKIGLQAKHPDGDWFDLRGLNITLANEIAVKRGADMILKFDSDQVGYENAINVFGKTEGLIFRQYEFVGDVFHLADPGPDSPFNDSVFTYEAKPGQWYYGGMAPVIYSPRRFYNNAWCAHLRHANPLHLSREEKLEHFYGRCWFRYLTNEGLWGKELIEKALSSALHLLELEGKPSTVPPPEVTLRDPFEYVEEVYG